MKILKTFFFYILFLASAIFIASCASQVEKQLSCTAEEHSKKLNILLHKLDTVTFEPTFSELERDLYRMRYAEQIVEVVGAMVARHQDQKTITCGIKLSPQQLLIFNHFSKQLQRHTEHLVEQIDEHQVESIKPHLKTINHTCDSCHQQLDIIIP